MFNGRRYCLTRLGLRLNVPPQIIKTVISTILSQEKAVKEATLAYIDDIYINEDIASSTRVQVKLVQFSLVFKDLELIENRAQVLGPEVWKELGRLLWRRGTAVPDIPDIIPPVNRFLPVLEACGPPTCVQVADRSKRCQSA